MNYKHDKWYHPDKIYQNDSQYHHIIAYIYDNQTDRLYHIKESEIKNSKSTHKDIIINNIQEFSTLITPLLKILREVYQDKDNYDYWVEDPHDVPETLQGLLDLKEKKYILFSVFLNNIRSLLEDEHDDRLVFGRSGINIIQIDSTRHINDDTALHSFWKDYNNSLVNSTVTKILELDSDYKNYENYVSRPSGTTLLNKRFTRNPDAEDKAKLARLAHLMAADQKKAELLSQGARPKGPNPWKQEALKYAYAEPWRLTSETRHSYTLAYKRLLEGYRHFGSS